MKPAFIFLIFALVLFWLSWWMRRRIGLPSFNVVYQDTRQGEALQKPLFDGKLRLTGRPDYLVREKGELIPVEVKHRKAPREPYGSHVMQLAAYCKLVEAEYGKRPDHGIIRYADKSFRVDFTPELEYELLGLLNEIRHDEMFDDAARSHQSKARCSGCGYAEVCDERL